MCSYLRHLDVVKLPKTNLDWCQVSQNGQISVTCKEGSILLVLQVRPFDDYTLPILSAKRLIIQPSSFALSENLDLNINTFLSKLSREQLYEAVLRMDMTAVLENGLPIESKIVKVAWSPGDMVDNYDCVVAILTNTSSLEIYIKTYDCSYTEQFVLLCNVTEMYIKLCSKMWIVASTLNAHEKFEEIKKRIDEVKPTVCAWSHKISQKYCILIVGHPRGKLTFWKMSTLQSKCLSNYHIVFLSEYHSKLDTISTICWKETNSKALIICSDIKGKVSILSVNYLDHIIIDKEIELLPENNVMVETIHTIIIDNYLYILIVKTSDLIIQALSNTEENNDILLFHVGNYKITGIVPIDDNKVLVSTSSGVLKELKLACVNSKITIEWRHIYVNINNYFYNLTSMVTSPNRVFIVFLMTPSKTSITKIIESELVFMYNTETNPLGMLLNNPTESFRNYWDCLEVLRLCSVQENKLHLQEKLPPDENYSTFSMYKLKLHWWLSKLNESFLGQNATECNILKSSGDIVELINFMKIVSRLKYLIELHTSNKISMFQLQNMDVLYNYIKSLVLGDAVKSFQLEDTVLTSVIAVVVKARSVDFPLPPKCMICGENIIGIECFPPHFDMRCAISYMQVDKLPCYKCIFCKNIVNNNLENEVDIILCPMCDIPLVKGLLIPLEITRH